MSTESKMPLTAREAHYHRLDSWKEIAQFLNRDVRTVQRWEQTGGLPVHRVVQEGHKRSSVYAFESELAAWLGPDATNPLPQKGLSNQRFP